MQPLAEAVADNIKQMYGDTEEARRSCENFVHIVESRAVERHQALINDALSKGATAVIGGTFTEADTEDRYTPATVLTGVTPDMKIMESEIFGPILPIIAYDSLEEASHSLYTFSENRKTESTKSSLAPHRVRPASIIAYCKLKICRSRSAESA